MKLLSTTIVCLLCTASLFAQETKLLQNFKYRINSFKALSISTSGNSNISDRDFPSNGKRSFVVGNLSGAFNFISSKDDKKTIVEFAMQNNLSRTKSEDFSAPFKRISANNLSNIGAKKTWYNKKYFFEISTNILGDYFKNDVKDFNNVKTLEFKEHITNIATGIGIGTGRLENITDMQNALWLNRALQADKNLTRTLTEIELNNLGKAITKANNTRVLDFRRRNKFLLKTVDGYLQENNLVEKTNIDYFNNLNDILFFAFNNPRLTGTEKYIRIQPAAFTRNEKYDSYTNFNKNENFVDNKSILFTVGIKKYEPKNLIIQNNFGVALSTIFGKFNNRFIYYYNNILTSEYKSTTNVKQTSLDCFYELSIYPNTRTVINFNVNTSLGVQKLNSTKSDFVNANVSGNLNYFINYNTRFTASIGGNYNKNKYDFNLIPNTNYKSFQLLTSVGLDLNF